MSSSSSSVRWAGLGGERGVNGHLFPLSPPHPEVQTPLSSHNPLARHPLSLPGLTAVEEMLGSPHPQQPLWYSRLPWSRVEMSPTSPPQPLGSTRLLTACAGPW